MQIITGFLPLKNFLTEQRSRGKKVGLVPTMGALHQGHAELIETSLRRKLVTVCSIYINPMQFNSKEDLKKYPRTLEADKNFLEMLGCDVLFCPTDDLIYPFGTPKIHFNLGTLETLMEGKFRPGHFQGVGLVVTKLFNLVQPDVAFFGQKDLQQFAVIKQLVDELFFPLELVQVPTVRSEQGLALSSRNSRLSDRDKQWALHLYKALSLGKAELLRNNTVDAVKKLIAEYFENIAEVDLEYFEVVDAESLDPVKHISQHKQVALCMAGYVHNIRLIDNLLLFSS